jgi:hypothetical protein
MKNHIWQCSKLIWTHCYSVVTIHVVSYDMFLNTDPGFIRALKELRPLFDFTLSDYKLT